jgi:hypothetical protein
MRAESGDGRGWSVTAKIAEISKEAFRSRSECKKMPKKQL